MIIHESHDRLCMDLCDILVCGQLPRLVREPCGALCAIYFSLVFFENSRKCCRVLIFTISNSDPLALDIERFYGQPKLLAQHVPIPQPPP